MLQVLVASTSLPVVVHDDTGAVLQANQAFADLLGYTLTEAHQLTAAQVIHPDDRDRRDADATDLLSGRRTAVATLRRVLTKDGTTLRARVHKTVGRHDGRVAVMVTIDDITGDHSRLTDLETAVHRDELTGILNRAGIRSHLAGLGPDRDPLRVVMLDINGLKQVNDQLGHDAGDELLAIVASRLLETVRSQDTVARYGGDEFVVVLENLSDRFQAALVAQKIIAAITAPIVIDGSLCDVSASIGIALTTDPDEDPDVLLRQADAAMYQAKRSSPGRFHFADDDAAGTATALPQPPEELRPHPLVAARRPGVSP